MTFLIIISIQRNKSDPLQLLLDERPLSNCLFLHLSDWQDKTDLVLVSLNIYLDQTSFSCYEFFF